MWYCKISYWCGWPQTLRPPRFYRFIPDIYIFIPHIYTRFKPNVYRFIPDIWNHMFYILEPVLSFCPPSSLFCTFLSLSVHQSLPAVPAVSSEEEGSGVGLVWSGLVEARSWPTTEPSMEVWEDIHGLTLEFCWTQIRVKDFWVLVDQGEQQTLPLAGFLLTFPWNWIIAGCHKRSIRTSPHGLASTRLSSPPLHVKLRVVSWSSLAVILSLVLKTNIILELVEGWFIVENRKRRDAYHQGMLGSLPQRFSR